MNKRKRGRPKGSGIDDSVTLEKVAELVHESPKLKFATAAKKLGIFDDSIIRRMREKWKTHSLEYLKRVPHRRERSGYASYNATTSAESFRKADAQTSFEAALSFDSPMAASASLFGEQVSSIHKLIAVGRPYDALCEIGRTQDVLGGLLMGPRGVQEVLEQLVPGSTMHGLQDALDWLAPVGSISSLRQAVEQLLPETYSFKR